MSKNDLISILKSQNWFGILQLDSKNKYPSNNSGVPRYPWCPLNSKVCPEFLVSSNLKTGIPTYTIISYKDWSSSRPIGTIVKYLGSVGDPNAEILARLNYHQLALSTWKYNINNYSLPVSEKLPHVDMTHLDNVYSIDPVGCKDIDDAFSYQFERRLLGIHIADVSYILRETNLLNTLYDLKNRYSSIYLPNNVLHLLPENISTNLASLLPDQSRLVWTLWIKLDALNKIESWNWERNIIKSKRAWSYEEAESSDEIHKISEIVRDIGEKVLGIFKKDWGTHEMIEILMVLMNHYLAKDLSNNFQYGIYRIHKESIKIPTNTNNNYDLELNKILELLQMESAQYVYDEGNYYHTGLGLDKYTHCTSPIRRIVDIYNHLMLEELIYGKVRKDYQPWKLDLEDVNDFQKRNKKLQRDINKITLMQDCSNGYGEYVGYLIGSDKKYQLYLSEKRLIINIRLWSKKIDHLIKVEESDKEIILNESFIIPKYQLGKYRIFAQPNALNFNDKIKVEINGLTEFLNHL
jgi:exoribonuclease R